MQSRIHSGVKSWDGGMCRLVVAMLMAVLLAACAGAGVGTQPLGSGVRAVLNAQGDVIAHQAFRPETRRWYDAELTNGSTAVLTQRGQLSLQLDRRRQTRGR